jgi:hypothetical protein
LIERSGASFDSSLASNYPAREIGPNDQVGFVKGELDEERRSIRAELLTEAHRLRSELTREFADNLWEQKIQNAQLKETLAKLRVAATGEETPVLRTH